MTYHLTHGTPADCAMSVDIILSPDAYMASGPGPIHRIPDSRHARGNAGSSEACPHPGHTASHSVCSAIVRMIGTFA